jgi:DNA-directed RNA polymerase subunit L
MFESFEKENLTTKFTISPFHVTYANTLRRTILTGVETIAFRSDMTEKGTTSDVIIYKNDTAMTNEMLADRVGLIPINWNSPRNWEDSQYKFVLDVTNEGDDQLDVVAADFKVYEINKTTGEEIKIPTETFFPPNPLTKRTVLIATLRPKGLGGQKGEQIHFEAKATIGTGRQHARFIPVSQCSYTYSLDNNEEKIQQYFNKWLSDQKKETPSTISDELRQIYKREFNTMEIQRCYKLNEKNEPYSFDFVIETIGVLDVPYIVMRACDVIEMMCARYTSVNVGQLPDELTIHGSESSITLSNNNMVAYDLMFKGHDHTLGNLLQTWIVDNMIEKQHESKIKVLYAGYKVPHPLRDEMLLRIAVEDGQESTVRDVLSIACKGCIKIFSTLKSEWISKTGAKVQERKTTVKVTQQPVEVGYANSSSNSNSASTEYSFMNSNSNSSTSSN